jgi:hypothetical protein
MQAVEEKGEGSALDKPMKVTDSLAELLAAGLRKRDGIHRNDWERTAAGSFPFELFLDGLAVNGLCYRQDRFWLEECALNIADTIVPLVYLHMMEKLTNI